MYLCVVWDSHSKQLLLTSTALTSRSVCWRRSVVTVRKNLNFLDRSMFERRTALFWAITQRIVVIPHRRFGTNCRLKTGPTGCPETSSRNYHYSRHNNPEASSSHLLRGGSFSSHICLKGLDIYTGYDWKFHKGRLGGSFKSYSISNKSDPSN